MTTVENHGHGSAKSHIIAKVCTALQAGVLSEAKGIVAEEYPFKPLKKEGRTCRDYQKLRIFMRDGFIDRYSGERLIFPPILRIISLAMPEEFPFHKNWKMSDCHPAYWHLLPTVDHVVPVSRGGFDEESNWVCTSQLRNGAKSNWLLDELGWQLHEAGDMKDWDGLLGFFMKYILDNPDTLKNDYIRSWYRATKQAKVTC